MAFTPSICHPRPGTPDVTRPRPRPPAEGCPSFRPPCAPDTASPVLCQWLRPKAPSAASLVAVSVAGKLIREIKKERKVSLFDTFHWDRLQC